MSTFNAGTIEASLTLDRSSWDRELADLEREFEELENKTITVLIDADTDNARIAMDNIELFLDDLAEHTYTPSVDLDTAPALEAAATLEPILTAIDENNLSVHVGTSGMPETMAELAALEAEIEVVDHSNISVDVDYNKNALESLVGDGSSGGGGGYMGFFQILIAAIIALSPILVVAIGAMLVALVAFASAVFAALGPLVLIGAAIAYLITQYAKAKKAGDEMTGGMAIFANELGVVQDTLKHMMDGKVGLDFWKAMADGLAILNLVLIAAKPLLEQAGQFILGIADSLKKFVQGPEFKSWLDFFGGFGFTALSDFVSIGANLIKFLVELFIAISPFARSMMGGLVQDFQNLADWGKHLKDDKSFQQWVDNARHYGPLLIDMLVQIFKAFQHLGDALRPIAGPMIGIITGLSVAIQDIPTKNLTELIILASAIYGAWKIVVPVIDGLATAFDAIGAAFGADTVAFGLALGPLLLIVAAAAAVAAMFVYMFETNKTFHDSIIKTWDEIQKAVLPIITAIVGLVKSDWPEIEDTAKQVWANVKQIFVSAAGILQAEVAAITMVITFIWNHFGDQLLRILQTDIQLILAIVRGAFQILAGLFALVDDLLHGRWSKLWGDIKQILSGAWTIILGVVRASVQLLGALFTIVERIVTGIWQGLWSLVKQLARDALSWVEGKLSDFVGWLGGLPGAIAKQLEGAFDSLVSEFAKAIDSIISYWNNLDFHVPGLSIKGHQIFGGADIGTPNLPLLANGAWVDKPTLAVVGEGEEPEIVSPESKMADIVRKYSSTVDYGKMAAAMAAVLQPIFGSVVTPDMLQKILSAAGKHVSVDASNDNQSASELASEIVWQLRTLDYGAVA